jgi:quercetin dioxygenase-like cupin family protein
MKPGSLLPEHKHLHEQISYVLEGEVEATIDTGSKVLRPGDLFSVKSNTSHSCRALGQPVKIIVASSPLLRDYIFAEE